MIYKTEEKLIKHNILRLTTKEAYDDFLEHDWR